MAKEDYNNSIHEFYRDRSIFITGASGFMGKVLVEKLLYSCSDVKQIFILLRPKREKSVEARLEEMFKLAMFDRIRKEKPQVLKKLVVVQGDFNMDGLGLTEEAKERLIREVSIVFHVGAAVRAETTLKETIEMNVTGTWKVIQLCKEMKKLEAFVHTSTAFCYPELEVLEEKTYDYHYNPEDIMRLIQWIDCKQLNKIEKELIDPHPNTYTFSKRLAEQLVIQEFPNMPMCIVRPSIVCPTYRDPIPGWADNVNGPVGIIAAMGKGVLRTMHCNTDLYGEMIPVDYAINAMLAIGKQTALEKKPAEIPVYNLTQGNERRMTWGEFLEEARPLLWEYPSLITLWYPGGSASKNYWVHQFFALIFHWLPAYFIDFILLLFRQKRFMVRVQTKISIGLGFVQYYLLRQWYFRNQRFLEIVKNMSPHDKEVFFIDFKNPVFRDYIINCILGCLVYIFKESLDDLPKAKRLIRVLYVLDRLVRVIFWAYVIKFVLSWASGMSFVFESTGSSWKNIPFARSFVS